MESFEEYRRLLFSIAYRMLGSAMEAEDMVQETYLHYQATPAGSIRSPQAFLTTVVTRLCINFLQTARVQRETYIGPWLPEPVLTGGDTLLATSEQANLHESISMAFLVLLETLTPIERAVFLLREVFDYEYAEIAEIVEKEESACRQLFSRAKKHIAEHRPRFKPEPERHSRFLTQFIQVVRTGELGGLMELLDEDVTMWADGGGKARGAATRPLHGRDAVARFLLSSTRLLVEDYRIELAEVNGDPSVIVRTGTSAVFVLAIEMDEDRIKEIRVVGNPDKLQRL